MKLLWNGEALDEFTPSKGIRQGDSISPYLFVLCIERLFYLTNAAVRNKDLRPIQLTKCCIPLSLLAFSDDILLFTEASWIRRIPSYIFSIPFVNAPASVSARTKPEFSSQVICLEKPYGTFRMSSVSKLQMIWENILGCLFFINEWLRILSDSLLTKHLSSWKAQTLSLAGRVTLAKSVIQALPIYVMQSCLLPKGVCDDLDKICCSFVWGKDNGQRKLHQNCEFGFHDEGLLESLF